MVPVGKTTSYYCTANAYTTIHKSNPICNYSFCFKIIELRKNRRRLEQFVDKYNNKPPLTEPPLTETNWKEAEELCHHHYPTQKQSVISPLLQFLKPHIPKHTQHWQNNFLTTIVPIRHLYQPSLYIIFLGSLDNRYSDRGSLQYHYNTIQSRRAETLAK